MLRFEDIKKANEAIKTTPIKGKEYAEVNQRVKAFRMLYPEGTIETEILSLQDGVVVMRATVKDGDKVLATGLSYEKENSSMINRTSYIENCETSAVGRALGFCGLGIDTSICSAEELKIALENQIQNNEVKENTYMSFLDDFIFYHPDMKERLFRKYKLTDIEQVKSLTSDVIDRLVTDVKVAQQKLEAKANESE